MLQVLGSLRSMVAPAWQALKYRVALQALELMRLMAVPLLLILKYQVM